MDTDLILPKRPLGSTGLCVSVLGVGTVKFGRNQKIKYPAFELPSDSAILQLLDDAQEHGINLLDTAPAYGNAEERLGALLGSRRDRFVIVTKTGEEFANAESAFDFSAEHTRLSVERSLKRLRTDRIDCVLVHCPQNDFDVLNDSPVFETLRRIKERGDIRSFGASINSIAGGYQTVENADVVMVTYSISDTSHEPVIRRAEKCGAGVLIKKGLASGNVIANNPELSLKDKLCPLFASTAVSSVIIGTINREHLRANALAALSVASGRE
jgi:aryl-alcohol dehydrogenase-like predicted oxidoreductase